LALFDFAAAKKNSSPRYIRAKFPELSDSEFATLRSRLHDHIVEAMGEYQRKHRPEAQVQVLVEATEALMHKGQHADAQRTLVKAVKLAATMEEYGSLETMQVLKRRLKEFLLGDKKAEGKWQALETGLADLVAAEKTYRQNREWLQAALDLKQGGLEGRRAKAQALLAAMPALDEEQFNKSNLLLARALWLCRFFLRDDAGCEGLLDWVIAHGREYGRLWWGLETFEAIEAAHSMKAAFLGRNHQYDAALALLNQFREECLGAKKFLLPDLKDLHRLFKTQKAIHTGQSKTIQNDLARLRKEIGKPANVGNFLYTLYMVVLTHCLEKRDFQAAKPWLELLADGKPLLKRAAKVIDGFVIELALRYAAGDYDEVENGSRRLLYFAETRNCDLAYVDTVVKGFRNLAKTSNQPQQALQAFIAALEAQEQREEFDGYAVMFDLKAFLKSMMNE
jgi:hypothetical protein